MEITAEIEKTCGLQPPGVIYTDPGNDPNFVFINDPSFNAVTLFDVEKNTINVNSWIECVHYLKGGWTNSQFISSLSEQYLSYSLLLVAAISTLLTIYMKKRSNEIS